MFPGWYGGDDIADPGHSCVKDIYFVILPNHAPLKEMLTFSEAEGRCNQFGMRIPTFTTGAGIANCFFATALYTIYKSFPISQRPAFFWNDSKDGQKYYKNSGGADIAVEDDTTAQFLCECKLITVVVDVCLLVNSALELSFGGQESTVGPI